MVLTSRLLEAEVFHKRHTPAVHVFKHKVCFLALNLDEPVRSKFLSVNRFNLFSWHFKDYGFAKFTNPKQHVLDTILPFHPGFKAITSIVLITLPKVLGYGFNPVSFWLCFNQGLIAVLAEVNNTFGDRHSYLCFHPDLRTIQPDDWFYHDKLMYVSPFCKVEGKYDLRFDVSEEKTLININYKTETGKLLSTSINAKSKPLNEKNLLKYFFIYPFMSFKIIFLIHYHVFRIWMKKVPFSKKTKKNPPHVT